MKYFNSYFSLFARAIRSSAPMRTAGVGLVLFLWAAMPIVRAQSGMAGDLQWELTDGTLRITGDSAMPNYYPGSAPWYAHRADITSAEVGEGVTRIDAYAFYQCNNLRSIRMPETLESIGYGAFYNCRGLSVVVIPASVTSIEDYAFESCTGLTMVVNMNTAPQSITSSVFIGGVNLSMVRLLVPEASVEAYQSTAVWQSFGSITAVSDLMLSHSSSTLLTGRTLQLEAVVLNGETISWASNNPGVATVDAATGLITAVAAGETTITATAGTVEKTCTLTVVAPACGDYTDGGSTGTLVWTLCTDGTLHITGTGAMPDYFYSNDMPWYAHRTSITSVEIGEGVTRIGNNAFFNLYNLTSVSFPATLTSIGVASFANCHSLTSVHLPASLSSIEANSFAYCSALAVITVDEANPYFSLADGVLFNEDQTLLMRYPSARSGTSYTVPETVTTIAGHAFSNGTNLNTVTIPASVTNIDDYAFVNCSGLTRVITRTATPAQAYEYAFNNANTDDCILWVPAGSVDAYKAALGWKRFTNIAALDDVMLNRLSATLKVDETVQLASTADPAPTITWESEDPSVATVDENGLVRAVGNGTTNITATVGGGTPAVCTVAVYTPVCAGDDLRAEGATGTLRWQLCNDGTLHIIGIGAMSNYNIGNAPWAQYQSNITSVTIPEGVTAIGSNAFYGCIGLTSVTIPNSVTSIGYNAFCRCSGLTSVSISEGVTTFEQGVFSRCSELTSFIIPNGVTSINSYAFDYCTKLTSITIPASVTSIEGYYVFDNCTSLTQIINLAATPQTIGDNSIFRGVNTLTCQLLVPEGSLDAYSNADYWKDFLTKAEIDEELTVSPASATLFVGQTAQLEAMTITGEPISWESDDEDVATVDVTTGLVTAVSAGTATITASISGGTETSNATITVFASACTDYIASGDVGELFWALCTDGTFQIVGEGAMPDYEPYTTPWSQYRSSTITSVNIGEGVTHVGNNAFNTTLGLTSITLPASLTSIGNGAFSHCYSLPSITLPATVTNIGERAFSYCNSLAQIINLAATPQTIDNSTFLANMPKTSRTLWVPESSLEAYGSAPYWSEFLNKTRLSELMIVWPTTAIFTGQTKQLEAVSIDGEDITWSSNKTAVATVDATTGLVTAVAAGTATITASIKGGETTVDATITVLTSICEDYIASGVTGALAWALCTDGTLRIVGEGDIPDYSNYSAPWYPYSDDIIVANISEGVTGIGLIAFTYCGNLTTVHLPASLSSIEANSFAYCPALAVITVDEANPYFSLADGVLFNEEQTLLMKYPSARSGTSYTVPETVTTIASYAFHNGTNLNTVTIPASVTNIDNYAFSNCNGLTRVITRTATPAQAEYAFNNANIDDCILWVPTGSVETYKAALGWKRFTNISALDDVMLNRLSATLKVDETVQLASTADPAPTITWESEDPSVATVDENGLVTAAGVGVTNITATVGGGMPAICTITVYAPVCTGDDLRAEGATGTLVWQLCNDGTLHIMGAGGIPNYSWGSAPWYQYRSDIISVNIGEGVTHVGSYAFVEHSNLSIVALPASLTSIGDQAFYNCTGLSSITLPASLTSIGDQAFYNCTGLSSITLPASLTSIGDYAFQNCTGLSSITLPASLMSIGDYAFQNCTGLSSITLPASLTSIGNWAFSYCTDLAQIINLAATPQTIMYQTFYNVNKSTCQLWVPEGSLDAYSNADYWSDFLTKTEIGEELTVSHASATLFAGQTRQLGAMSIGGETVSWSSDDPGVATVDATTGLVTAVSAGEATITASINGGTETAGATITVYASVCDDYTATGSAGALTWALCTDGTLQIVGTGAMPDYGGYDTPWNPYRNNITAVNIGEGVTHVGNQAFWDYLNLITVTLPASLTSIGDLAFGVCQSISSFTIPASVTSFGNDVFQGSSGLTDIINLAATPQTIDWSSFQSVNKSICRLWVPEGSLDAYISAPYWSEFFNTAELTDLTVLQTTATLFADQTTQLDAIALAGEPISWSSNNGSVATVDATGLVTGVTAGKAVITASINGGAHTATSDITVLTSVCDTYTASGTTGTLAWAICTDGTLRIVGEGSMPDYLGYGAPWSQYRSAITAVNIGEGVPRIGSAAFFGHTNLSTVTLPTSVTSIGVQAFTDCYGLSSITIPASVTTINIYAFQNCTGLTQITNMATTPQVITDDTFSGMDKSNCTLTVPTGTEELYLAATGWKDFYIDVTIPVSNIILNKTDLELPIDQTETLGVTMIEPDNASNKDIVWSSTDPTVATVDDATGIVTAVSGGTATIKATAADGSGVFAGCTVTVTVPVTGVELNMTTRTLPVGDTETLIATVLPTNATNQAVTWSSDDDAIATVVDGLVTAEAAGTATITVTTDDGGHQAVCTITVIVPATGVSLNKDALALKVGEKQTLEATVEPAEATIKTVTWSSDAPTIATVNATTGEVTAVSAGTAKITATTTDGTNLTDDCAVTVTTVAVESVGVNKSTLPLTIGDTETLEATVLPGNATNKAVTWSSNNTAVATVNIATGLVTAVSAGTATITATTVDGGKTATCTVTVSAVSVTGVTIGESALDLLVGGTETLTASVLPDNATNKVVTWSSSNEAVATVNTAGLVTALSAGTATITVTTDDGGKTAICTVTVTAPVPVSGITLSKTTLALAVTATETLEATVAPANATNAAITWSSSVPSIATVDASTGLITAVVPGTATITATAADGSGMTAVCTVTVTQPVTSVALSKETLALMVGEEATLTATVAPDNATDKSVAWSTADASVATVDAAIGLITAVAPGETTITVTTVDGSKTASCVVTVTQPVTSVALSEETLALMVGEEATLTATVAPDNATDKSVAWSTGDAAIATVTGGVVKAVSAGTATITATATDGSGQTATCVVTVTAPAITSVTVTPATAAVRQGETQQFAAEAVTVGDISQAVTWSISGQAKDATGISAEGLLSIAIDESAATITVTATSVADKRKLGTATVTVERATGMAELTITDLKVYPNPFTSTVHLTGAEGCTLRVINAAGVTVHTQKITNPDETVRLEHLPTGVYFFRLEKDGRAKTVKVVRR